MTKNKDKRDDISLRMRFSKPLFEQITSWAFKNKTSISAQTRKLWADFLLKQSETAATIKDCLRNNNDENDKECK